MKPKLLEACKTLARYEGNDWLLKYFDLKEEYDKSDKATITASIMRLTYHTHGQVINTYNTDLNAVFRVVERLINQNNISDFEFNKHIDGWSFGFVGGEYIGKPNHFKEYSSDGETLCEAICLACAEYIRENE